MRRSSKRCHIDLGTAVGLLIGKVLGVSLFSWLSVPSLLKVGFYQTGQVCVSVQRVFVHESIAKDVANQLATSATKLIVGNPLDEKTEVGPLILPREVDWVFLLKT